MFKRYFVPILKVLGFVTVYMLVLGIATGLLYFLLGGAMKDKQAELLAGGISLAVTLLVTFLYLRLDKRSFGTIGAGFNKGWSGKLVKGTVEGAISILIIFSILLITGLAAIRGQMETNLLKIAADIFTGILIYLPIVAFGEELLTRGYIFHYLKTRVTTTGALIAASIVFALMHIFNPNATPLALFNIFLAGVLLNLLVLRDGNLWSAVGFHFGWNYTMGTIFASPVSGGREEGIIKLSLKGYELLTGGAFGIEGGIVCTLILLLVCVYLLNGSNSREELLDGLKLRKNRGLVGVLIIGVLIYVTYDILLWLPKPIPSDSITLNHVDRYAGAHDYSMELALDTRSKKLAGRQTVSFINNEEEQLKEAYFHIYPNAFREHGGGIDIKTVKVNDVDVKFRIEGQDSTLLYIPFNEDLEQGKRNQIFMEYDISIPREGGQGFGDRFGYGSNTFNLGNFFPIAAVYEAGSWDKHLYDKKGDAFYSETGNFDVKLTAPKEQVIASSGYVESYEASGRNQVLSIKAYSVRDFAFVSSDMFRVEDAMVNGTLIRSYASSSIKAKKILEYAADAIRVFNKDYGKYPYGVLSVVQSDIGGGMEYPNLVMIESNEYGNANFSNMLTRYFFGKTKGSLEFVVVHELAHQWWYGLVGNDEYREAWIDEPLTQYATLEYYRQRYGQEEFNRLYNRYIKLGVNMFLMAQAGENKPLNRPLDQFDENEYTILIYNKGTMMYKDLNDQLGDEKFDKLLRTLFDKYKFKVVTGEELIELTSEIAGKDMSGFYRDWLETNHTGDEL